MKRIFLTMLMCAVFGTTFAQMSPEEKAALKAAQKEAKAQVSEGIKLRDEVYTLYNAVIAEQGKGEKANQKVVTENTASIHEKSKVANEALLKALASGHVADKQMFDACKALDDVSTQLLNPELNKAAAHETFDTLLFAKAVDGVCKGCYGVLEHGNKKNELQKPTILQDGLKMPKLMTYYAYLCLFYTETKNLKGASDAFDKYVNFAKDYPLVANEPEVVNPQYPPSQFAFNLYYTAYQLKDVEACEKYYPLALTFNDKTSHDFVVSSRPQLYRELQDTAKWVAALEEVATKHAGTDAGETAIQNLLSIAGHHGNAEMAKAADELLAKFPTSKVANYGKGYSFFAQEKYEESLAYFQKSVEIDPEYAEGHFMCGTSIYRQALANYYKYIDSKKYKSAAEMNAAEEKYVKSYFRKAKGYFERCRELNPTRVDDWAGPLQNIYKNLGEKEKAAEMTELLK